MVFEFCEGGNLKTNLTKNAMKWRSNLSKYQACLDATKGIDCLHSHGFIHRDIKTENFFVGKRQVVKLGDFGEATRVRNHESTKSKRMTILGTVAYMAPELVSAERYYNQSIDIYALGVTFWEIWSGEDPFDNCSQFKIYERIKNGVILEIPEDFPKSLKDILLASWEADPAKRPSSKELVLLIEAAIEAQKSLNMRNSTEMIEGTVPEPLENTEYKETEISEETKEVVVNPIFLQISAPAPTVVTETKSSETSVSLPERGIPAADALEDVE
jgi:serine/threonine protein kinase